VSADTTTPPLDLVEIEDAYRVVFPKVADLGRSGERLAAAIPQLLAEVERLRAEVEKLRTDRNTAVSTVAEQWKRSLTREREHNADREARDRLRAELTELQGQNTQTEVNFENYVEAAISRENELLDLLRSLEDSVSHDFDSAACLERPAYQERLKPCQQRESDHSEPCPACVLAAELAANTTP